jgi:hypothetical protein
MTGAGMVWMTTHQLLAANTVEHLQRDGGPLLSVASTGLTVDPSGTTPIQPKPRLTPHCDPIIVRPPVAIASESGRCGQPNRTIPIATAPYAV